MPSFRYFMVTWGVGGEFGGMTSMCLTRARTMRQFSGTHAPVLTFDFQPDYSEILGSLHQSGHLVDGMEIRNLYHYYRAADLDGRAPAPDEGGRKLEIPQQDIQAQTVRDGDGGVFCRIIRSLDGEREYRREYWRPDESIFLTETTEYDDNGEQHRELRLMTRSGATVRVFKSREDLFRFWMVEQTEGEPSVFVADSVQTTQFTGRIRAKHVMKMAVMHNSHVAGGGEPLRGRLGGGRRDVVLQSQRWDGILFLTERHRQDFVDRFGSANNLFVLSNPAPRADEFPPFSRRVPARGVMLCRLEDAKNVFAAIDIIDIVRRSVPAIRLDIYGRGKQRQDIEGRIAELGLQDNIQLHGHAPDASGQFSTATFSLLTSRKEGQPLVLLESQGQGCPPVAFNVRYGPDDVISDGENGFLVDEADVQTAAEHVSALCSDDALARRMSKSAWAASERYSYSQVLKRFGSIVDRAWTQRPGRLALANTAVKILSTTAGADGVAHIVASFTWKQNAGPPAKDELMLRLQILPRHRGPTQTVSGQIVHREDGRLDVRFDLPRDQLVPEAPAEPRELFILAGGRNILFRQRIDAGFATVDNAL